METLPLETQDDSSEANPNIVKNDDSSPQHENNRGSPPPNCAICLGTCRNKCFTDSCLHQFCFKCLLTWSKVKAECPLCKQNFKSIIHNVRSNHQYDEYTVEQRQTEETTNRIDIDDLAATTRRFRYRTTLTLPRRDTFAIQQLLMQYPLMADVGVGPARAPPRRRSPAAFRRTVYRHNLWARPLPDFTGRYRDCSPLFYRSNCSQMQRLVPWINRELHYLLNENIQHISYVITRILELLPRYHINSPEFHEAMQRYFVDRTEHFLHELYCFASTPYDLTGYDRNVQYTTDTRISTMVNEIISSSESDASIDSDIVMVSSSEAAEPPPGPSRVPAPFYSQNYITPPQPTTDNVIPIETISHSDTDDDSSEVMVVGYIKPPQERTPEVVDLVGSDSDVVMQDNTQPEPSSTEVQEVQTQSRPPLIVKLSLKRHAAPAAEASQAGASGGESDSDGSTYTPPTLPASPPARRKRRRVSSPPLPRTVSPVNSEWTPSVHSEFSTDSSSDSSTTVPQMSDISSSSSNDRIKKTKKKSRRKTASKTKRNQGRKKVKKQSKGHHKEKKKSQPDLDSEKRSKRKSHSGKGVKSSRSNEVASTSVISFDANVPSLALDQPSTSGIPNGRKSNKSRKRRRSSKESRESKKLKSVVNVMKKSVHSTDSSSSGNSNLLNMLSSAILNPRSAYNSDSGSIPGDERTSSVPQEILKKADLCLNIKNGTSHQNEEFDSEDDFPLNLTIQKPK